jgi:hypothetical protein
MKDAIASLFSSRKFIVTVLALAAMAPLLYTGKISVEQFIASVEKLAMVLVAAIAAEGVAEKWGALAAPFPGPVTPPAVETPAVDAAPKEKAAS